MKRTPLYEEHVSLGATIVPFAGWEMPVYYTSVIDEHTAVREKAGLFDTSHMGEIIVSGAASDRFLDSIMTNEIARLIPGEAVYSAMTNERGGCVDDLWIYKLPEENFLLCVNASRKDIDFEWIVGKAKGWEVDISDDSDRWGMIALQGPAAIDIFRKIATGNAPERFRFAQMEVAGTGCIVSRTGYTGEDGVELYADVERTAELWREVLEAGKPFGLKPTGLGARDTLRLEACYSLFGHELSEDITPVEAGISFAVARRAKFPGNQIILEQMNKGPERKIVAFELIERGVPRETYPVFSGGERAGVTTSGCYSPTLKKGIGLAMLDMRHAAVGTDIEIEIRGKRYAGRIVRRPFVSNVGGKKK